jgi:glycosyltransferase involved in cell wall biosynthesis
MTNTTTQVGVSVILTTYNGATRGYLKQAIQSVLRQTHAAFELIIVDDGSQDNTASLCAEFLGDARVRYLYQDNRGLASARNTGIRHATYDYISFLDDDDLYENEMIEKLLDKWNKHSHSKCGLIYCGVKEINYLGSFLKERPVSKCGNIHASLFWGNFITASALMVKRSVFEDVGYFNENLRYCEDYDMWLRIAQTYEIQAHADLLVQYRVHPKSLSKNLKEMQRHQKLILDTHMRSAPDEIKVQYKPIYCQYYQCCAAQCLGNEQFSEFRVHYQQASTYGSIEAIWKIKYYLSYAPALFKLARRFKRL